MNCDEDFEDDFEALEAFDELPDAHHCSSRDSENFRVVSGDLDILQTYGGLVLKEILKNLENHPTSVNEAVSAMDSALKDLLNIRAVVTMEKCEFPDFIDAIFKLSGMEKNVQCEISAQKVSSTKTVKPERPKGWKILVQIADHDETIVQFYVKRKKKNVKNLRSLAADVVADSMEDEDVEKLDIPGIIFIPVEVKKDVIKSINDYWTA